MVKKINEWFNYSKLWDKVKETYRNQKKSRMSEVYQKIGAKYFWETFRKLQTTKELEGKKKRRNQE